MSIKTAYMLQRFALQRSDLSREAQIQLGLKIVLKLKFLHATHQVILNYRKIIIRLRIRIKQEHNIQ